MPADRSVLRGDAWVALAGLLVVLAWESSGLDLAVTRWVGSPTGFAWRDSVLASGVLHDGGRILGWSLLSLLIVDAIRPLLRGPSRPERLLGIGSVLSAVVLVPLTKRFSQTSCPWDLAEFGGSAAYVPHWFPGLTDGGPGHCFPSGHAVAAFAFFGVYFFWRTRRPTLSRVALAIVCALGIAFGWAQWIRGAHFVSHTLWSAWLCWSIGALAYRLRPAMMHSATRLSSMAPARRDA
jgi:membrane-associated PAP2 superfamily phosphatase